MLRAHAAAPEKFHLGLAEADDIVGVTGGASATVVRFTALYFSECTEIRMIHAVFAKRSTPEIVSLLRRLKCCPAPADISLDQSFARGSGGKKE